LNKRMLSWIAALSGVAMIALAQKPASETDGYMHGDAPYLLEDGWTPLLNGRDLAGWHGQDDKQNDWFTARGIRWEPYVAPGPARLSAISAPGGAILNGGGRTANLVSDAGFGDVELYLEFMTAKGTNSGVYLQGLYEVQIFDSYASILLPRIVNFAMEPDFLQQLIVAPASPRLCSKVQPRQETLL
jgi:hypothetical protein